MSDRILVPFDGGRPSEAALEYAFEKFSDAAVTALYVIDVPEWEARLLEDRELTLPVTERAREYARGVLEDAEAIADEYGRDLETAVATGDPKRRIIDRAEDGAYDTIVVGNHGRDDLSNVLLGSVAENVARRSPVPVVVVR